MRFFVLIISLLVFSSCDWGSDTIAEVGAFKITKQDYKYFLVKRYGEKESYKDVPKAEKDAMIDQMIIRKLKANLAFDTGLDKNKKIVNDYNSRKGQMVSNLYFERSIIDNLFSEERIHREFEMKKIEVKASHVLISYKEAARTMNDRTQDEALELALEVAKRARDGKNTIAQLALMRSDDQNVRDNRGNLGYFEWGTMVEPFQEAAYKMEIGDISDPVLSEFGYHVIQVFDKRKNLKFSEGKYEDSKEHIKRSLYRTHQDSARALWEEHLLKLKEGSQFKYFGNNIKTLVAANSERKIKNDFSVKSFKDEEKDLKLAEWDKGAFYFKDLLNTYGSQIGRYVSTLTDSIKFKKDIEKIASHQYVVSLGEEMGLHKEKNIADQLSNFLEYSMIKILENSEVKEKVSFDDEDLKEYYASNRTEFVTPEKIEVWEIFIKDEKKVHALTADIKQGILDFKKAAERHSEDKISRKKSGYLGYKSLNGRANVSKAAFEAGENSLTGPVKYRNGWAIIKTGKKQAQSLRSFEQAKNIINKKVENKKTRERKAEWEKEMRKLYSVTINKDIIAEM